MNWHWLFPWQRVEDQLDEALALLRAITLKEGRLMALGQDILDAVTAETTQIKSFIAFVQGLIDNGTIPAATGAAILAKINEGGQALTDAVAANTQPPTP